MHAPEQTVEHFERLLPYAIALDVEKHWSERFETILADAAEKDGYHPTWHGGIFQAASFGAMTNEFGRSLVAAPEVPAVVFPVVEAAAAEVEAGKSLTT